MGKYTKYCKCTIRKSMETGRPEKVKCEFCSKYDRLRTYVSKKKRIERDGGTLPNQSLFTLGALHQWFKNVTGYDYTDERPKTYHKENKPITTAKEFQKKCPSISELKHIIGAPISPDTFEFKDNRIFIKDSRDIKIIEINLSTRTISILQDSKYKAMILTDILPFAELIKSYEQITKIRKALEE